MTTIETSPALQIPDRQFAAYLFDLDGTVADSMPLHFRAWTQAVMEAGGTFPEDVFYALGGVPLPRTVEILNERYGSNMPVDATVERKEGLYLALLHEVKPVAAVLEHIRAMHGKIPFAIVSGSPCASIEKTLSALGLRDYFNLIVGAEDYAHGKPDPEPFLTAAQRLGVAAQDCLVFEDADAGIEAARRAGMAWVRVPMAAVAAAESIFPDDVSPIMVRGGRFP